MEETHRNTVVNSGIEQHLESGFKGNEQMHRPLKNDKNV